MSKRSLLAAEISIMGETEQVKFKAVLDAENTASIHDALNVNYKICGVMNLLAEPDIRMPFSRSILKTQAQSSTAGGLKTCFREMKRINCSAASAHPLPITALFPHETVNCSSPFQYDEPEARN